MTKADLPEVRIIRPGDEDEIMAMCRLLHAENGMFSMNEDKVRAYFKKCFDREGTIIGVIGEAGHVEASICLVISDNWYTDDWHLAEAWNYVLPDYRRSSNAEALLEFAKECADKMKIPLFTGIITNKQMSGKVRLYRRLLGYPCGAFFIYNSSWKTEPMVDHGELRDRLRQFAQKCSDGKVSSGVAKKQIAPLLGEAADALGREDNVWGGVSKPKNSAATAQANGSD